MPARGAWFRPRRRRSRPGWWPSLGASSSAPISAGRFLVVAAWTVAPLPSGLLVGEADDGAVQRRCVGRSACPPEGSGRSQMGLITMADLRDHDADLLDHDGPIPLITMRRSW